MPDQVGHSVHKRLLDILLLKPRLLPIAGGMPDESVEEAIIEASKGSALIGLQEGVKVTLGHSAEDAFNGAKVLCVRHER